MILGTDAKTALAMKEEQLLRTAGILVIKQSDRRPNIDRLILRQQGVLEADDRTRQTVLDNWKLEALGVQAADPATRKQVLAAISSKEKHEVRAEPAAAANTLTSRAFAMVARVAHAVMPNAAPRVEVLGRAR